MRAARPAFCARYHNAITELAAPTVQCGCPTASIDAKNQLHSIRSYLSAQTKTNPAIHLICEATGGMEKLVVAVAHALQIPVTIANPRQVRDFARSLGRLKKNRPHRRRRPAIVRRTLATPGERAP